MRLKIRLNELEKYKSDNEQIQVEIENKKYNQQEILNFLESKVKSEKLNNIEGFSSLSYINFWTFITFVIIIIILLLITKK